MGNRRVLLLCLMLAPAANVVSQPIGPIQSRQGCIVDLDMRGAAPAYVDWTGACQAGKATGSGVLTLQYAESRSTYEGTMSNGKRDGNGRYAYLDGRVYEGGFRNDSPSGTGEIIYPNGNRLQGQFDNGVMRSGALYGPSGEKIKNLAAGANPRDIYLLAAAPHTSTPATRYERVAQATSASGRCRSNMQYLAGRIPVTGNAQVDSIRSQVLATDVMEVMRSASTQGYSPNAAVQATLDQAREFDRTTAEALSAAAATDAFGTTDDQFLDKLKSGKISIKQCDGIRNNSLCAAAITKIGAIVNRAVAAEMQCHIRANTWPR